MFVCVSAVWSGLKKLDCVAAHRAAAWHGQIRASPRAQRLHPAQSGSQDAFIMQTHASEVHGRPAGRRSSSCVCGHSAVLDYTPLIPPESHPLRNEWVHPVKWGSLLRGRGGGGTSTAQWVLLRRVMNRSQTSNDGCTSHFQFGSATFNWLPAFFLCFLISCQSQKHTHAPFREALPWAAFQPAAGLGLKT